MQGFLTGFKIGADPELFIRELSTGRFVSSLDMIGGSKMFPRPTSVPGFLVQEDNILVEYNIPPSETKEAFGYNIRLGQELFKEVLDPNHYVVEVKSSHKFLPEQLLDPRADEFGCDPDKNAWLSGKLNPRPPVPKDGLRSAGGHIHVGYHLNENMMDDQYNPGIINMELAKHLDLLLAVPAMRLDKDTERRRLYGKAGSYRDKPYGMEYRTLSSFWVASKTLTDWVFDRTKAAVEKVSNMDFLDNTVAERIIAAINHNDQRAIDSLFSEYKLEVA